MTPTVETQLEGLQFLLSHAGVFTGKWQKYEL